MLEWLSVSFLSSSSSLHLQFSLTLAPRHPTQQQQQHHHQWNESAYFNALRPMFYSRYRHMNSAACTQFFAAVVVVWKMFITSFQNFHSLSFSLTHSTSILDFIWEQQKEEKRRKNSKSIKTLSSDHFFAAAFCAPLIWKNTIAFR